jgi:predicted HicB family RNase H-like nuclease
MNKLKYKDYQGSVELDTDRLVLRGKILFITDLVTYEADDPKGLKQEFEASVDDYIETCRILGREPKKEFSGVFNVRIEPDCHKALAQIASDDARTLNSIVAEGLRCYVLERLGPSKKIEHVHKLVVDEGVRSFTAITSQKVEWETVDVEVH